MGPQEGSFKMITPEDHTGKFQDPQTGAWITAEQWTQKVEAAKAQGKNPDGTPLKPEFSSFLDPKSGLLKDQYQLNYGSDITPNTQGLEAIRTRALSTGPSAWATLANQKQGLEEQGLKNQTQAQGASAEAQGRSALASKYGLSPAAQQRLAIQNQRNQMSGLQNVGFQGAKARADIGLQDEATKNQFLAALPGQENALAGAQMQNRQNQLGTQQYNISNAIGQNTLQNAYNTNNYAQQMAAYGANKNADAMQNQSGGKK